MPQSFTRTRQRLNSGFTEQMAFVTLGKHDCSIGLFCNEVTLHRVHLSSYILSSFHSGAKLQKIVGGVHNPNLPTNRFHSRPICRQIGLSLSSFRNAILTSAIDIWQMCRQAPKSSLHLLDKVQSKAIRLINNPNLTNSLQSLSLRRLVADLSTVYHYFQGHSSSSSLSSAVHVTASRWPPQFFHFIRGLAIRVQAFPAFPFMSSLHLRLGLPLLLFPSLGVHSVVIFAHLLLSRYAICPAHCPFMLPIRSVISFTLVLSLIVTTCPVILQIVLSMLLCATASLFS